MGVKNKFTAEWLFGSILLPVIALRPERRIAAEQPQHSRHPLGGFPITQRSVHARTEGVAAEEDPFKSPDATQVEVETILSQQMDYYPIRICEIIESDLISAR